jgi:NTE family protein
MIKIAALLLSVAFMTSAASADQKVCRALVMSGGANKGAYEVGVIHGLSHLLPGEEAHYDVVSGVSAGAMNAGAIAMWAPEQSIEMSEWLVAFWKTITSDMIY